MSASAGGDSLQAAIIAGLIVGLGAYRDMPQSEDPGFIIRVALATFSISLGSCTAPSFKVDFHSSSDRGESGGVVQEL